MNAYNLEQNNSHRTDTFLLGSLKELPPSLKSDERIGEGGGRWMCEPVCDIRLPMDGHWTEAELPSL